MLIIAPVFVTIIVSIVNQLNCVFHSYTKLLKLNQIYRELNPNVEMWNFTTQYLWSDSFITLQKILSLMIQKVYLLVPFPFSLLEVIASGGTTFVWSFFCKNEYSRNGDAIIICPINYLYLNKAWLKRIGGENNTGWLIIHQKVSFVRGWYYIVC